MSSGSPPQLGESDAVSRWWGLERHRLLLLVAGAVLVADALVRRDWREWEWPCAAVCAALTVVRSGHSWGERVVTEAQYHLRRRLTWVTMSVDGDALVLDVRGTRRVWCYDFVHWGRLDLAHRDGPLAGRLAHLADALAAAGEGVHLALHVESRGDAAARTTLSLTGPATPAREWRQDPRSGVVRSLSLGRTPVVERRDYVRTPDGVVRILRVSGLAPGREMVALDRLSEQLSWITLSLHASILPAPRARRMTSRAVHRVGSDAQLARSAGFRWTARREWELDALRQREAVVAGGAALCQWALYLAIHAPSLAHLRLRVLEASQIARTAGLRVDQGVAMQREWFVYQLPGGPGW